MCQQNKSVDDRKNHPCRNRFIAMSPKQELLQQRMRPDTGRMIQMLTRGWQIIAPHNMKGCAGDLPIADSHQPGLVYRTVTGCCAGKRLCRLQSYGAKCLLILRQVLAQQVPQRLGLLWAQIDPLKIPQHHFIGRILPGCAKDQHKIPYAGPHLHAVGIAIAIILRLNNVDIWRRMYWLTHATRVSRVEGCRLYQSLRNVQWRVAFAKTPGMLSRSMRLDSVLESIRFFSNYRARRGLPSIPVAWSRL